MSFSGCTDDEMYALARLANVEVYTRAQPIARKIAERYCKKYEWIHPDDLTQNLLLEIPKIMYTYDIDNERGNPWSKYLYFKLYFAAKDLLRKEDPLGIKWPQKKAYPKWHRLSDESLEGFFPQAAVVVHDDIDESEWDKDVENLRLVFSGLPSVRRVSRSKKRRLRKASGLWSWRVSRGHPRQMEMF